MSNKLSIWSVIRVELIASEAYGKRHSRWRPFDFAINVGFLNKLIGKVVLLDNLVAIFHFGSIFQIFKN